MNTKRRNARGELTLQTILQQTVSLVSSYGYDGTTIALITKSTGRPASSIYWFFQTKDELVAAALESTYTLKPSELPDWPVYTHDKSLHTQLHRILRNDFIPTAAEAPVRLGIMVALEGLAANSPVQEPFQARRSLVRLRVQKWWMAAAMDRLGPDCKNVAEWMTLLTLGFLDGHYISDVPADAIPSTYRGSDIVVTALVNAFEYLLVNVPDTTETPTTTSTTPEAGSVDTLLATTLALVAERGYEGATLRRICDRSQFQRSSIYWRYKGKDELIHAAVAPPFLDLFATGKLPHPPRCETWLNEIAADIQSGVATASSSADTVRAGLLLKLQRRDPAPLGSQAIQAGVRQEAEALEKWISLALNESPGRVDANELTWAINILREGLFLGVAFGYDYLTNDLEGLILAMIQGIVTATQSVDSFA